MLLCFKANLLAITFLSCFRTPPFDFTRSTILSGDCFDLNRRPLSPRSYFNLQKTFQITSDLLSPFSPPSRSFGSTMHESMPSSMARGRRPKTTYYHNGIGGRGNYHKRDDETYPTSRQQRRSNISRSIAAFFSGSIGGSGNFYHESKVPTLTGDEELAHSKVREMHFRSRWFIRIGGLGNRRARRQHSPSSDMSATTVTSENSSQALPLGAADVMRQKILGERSATKTV